MNLSRIRFLFAFCISSFFTLSSYAQLETYTGAETAAARLLGKTGPLKDKLKPVTSNIQEKKQLLKSDFKEFVNFRNAVPIPHNNPNPLPNGADPLRRLQAHASVMIPVEPIVNIDGIDYDEARYLPPDSNGDISPDHFIQTTNGSGGSVFNIYDKVGNLLMGPTSMNVIWEDFGFVGLGDPVVLWDQGAERWLFTEIGSQGNVFLIAISETSDPMGSFFAYEFQTPKFPDYPKYGVWNDGYYVTTNEGGSPSIPIYVLDRAAMLNGESTVNVQALGVPKFPASNTNYAHQVATPVDWDGANNPPPADAPHLVMRLYDDAWNGGQDKLEIWEIDIDWNDANSTTITGPIEVFPEPFDSDLCNENTNDCLNAPNGIKISALMQVLMHRVQYRNFGAYESMVLNHVVDVDGNDLAGVRWYELRKPAGGQWDRYQEGTVSPDDNHRWLASIAMDAAGNIGLGYSVMGPDHTYDLAITGRRFSDPLGVMTIDEQILVKGKSFNTSSRWGDYSMMTVDETDGRTFWFTGEYMQEGGVWDWGTRIASFLVGRDTIDIGPLNLLSPQTSGYFTDSEIVEVEVKNFGLENQTNFEVGFFLNNIFIESKMITSVVEPDSTIRIVFGTGVDLSSFGDYEFKIFTNLSGDQNILNDTLRKKVTQLPGFNLAVSAFTNVNSIICDTVLAAGIVLTNKGAETITSAVVDWSFNNGANQTINWMGALDMGMSDTIFVFLDPLQNGNNEIRATSSSPNNMADEDMSDDSLIQNFQANTTEAYLLFTLLTDGSPNETTWEVRDEMGTILYEGGSYTSVETEYTEQWCLTNGCYSFTIFDSFGDGIQSGGVQGNYTISNEDGKVLASLLVPNFGTSETNEFCTPFVCTLEGTASTMNESSIGENDGTIILSSINGTAPFEYSIDDGTNFQSSPLFESVSGGSYTVVIGDANGCTTSFEVVVETCLLQLAAVISNAHEGQTDGTVEVNVENGIAPFSYSLDGGLTFQNSNIFDNLGSGAYSIFVVDSIGCEATIEVDVEVIVSIEVTYVGNSIKIFPNPTDGVFRVNISGVSDVSTMDVMVFDAVGSVIQRRRLARFGEELTGLFSLRNLPVGVYYLQFDHQDIKRMAKIVRR